MPLLKLIDKWNFLLKTTQHFSMNLYDQTHVRKCFVTRNFRDIFLPMKSWPSQNDWTSIFKGKFILKIRTSKLSCTILVICCSIFFLTFPTMLSVWARTEFIQCIQSFHHLHYNILTVNLMVLHCKYVFFKENKSENINNLSWLKISKKFLKLFPVI